MTQIEFLPQGSVTSPQGFQACGIAAHIKYERRLDLALIVSQQDCAAAAVFTRNQVIAAPVTVDRETLAANPHAQRVVVINAGNANACTGELGLYNARQTQLAAAEALGCRPDQVQVMSTGVIGVQLPMNRIRDGLETAVSQLSANGGPDAARAIMTTDTHPKHVAVRLTLPEGEVAIGGMAKGAGMIHPDMATMLSLITTDAAVNAAALDALLRTAVDVSFNRISIDGDTSTNDTLLLLANGAAGVTIHEDNRALFLEALTAVCVQLAHMIVKDGEGASKFVEIHVTGTADDTSAHTIANTIAISPLVKTAFAGSDANWGRLLMAAGRAGVPFDQYQVNLWIGVEDAHTLQIVRDGTPTAYAESDAAAIFAEPAFKIWLSVGTGGGQATVWTSDLTHEYVSINADYRT